MAEEEKKHRDYTLVITAPDDSVLRLSLGSKRLIALDLRDRINECDGWSAKVVLPPKPQEEREVK